MGATSSTNIDIDKKDFSENIDKSDDVAGMIVSLVMKGSLDNMITSPCTEIDGIMQGKIAKSCVTNSFNNDEHGLSFVVDRQTNIWDLYHSIRLIIYGDQNDLDTLTISQLIKDEYIKLASCPIELLISTQTIKKTEEYTIVNISESPYFIKIIDNFHIQSSVMFNITKKTDKKDSNPIVKMVGEVIALDTNDRRRLYTKPFNQMTYNHQKYTHTQ